MDDRIFRELADSQPMHHAWVFGLPDMWSEIEKTLGHGVRFLTEQQRAAVLP